MKHIVVTGANKGIGLAIVKGLLRDNPDVYVYLGSRDAGRGLTAIEQIGAEIGQSAKQRIELLEIDVTSDISVHTAAESIRKSLDGPIYGLVNNAGGASEEMSARQIIDLNTYGVRRVSEAFLPLIQKEKGRIVQVSSGAAPKFLQKCSDEIKVLLANRQDVNWEVIENTVIKLALKIREDPAMGEEEKARAISEIGLGEMGDGRLGHAYGMSKACVNAYTFYLSNQYPKLLLNSCSPGMIETDLMRPFAEREGKKPEEMGMLPPEKGTIAPIHLLMDDLEVTGAYFGSDGKRSPMHKYRSPGDPEYDGAFP